MGVAHFCDDIVIAPSVNFVDEFVINTPPAAYNAGAVEKSVNGTTSFTAAAFAPTAEKHIIKVIKIAVNLNFFIIKPPSLVRRGLVYFILNEFRADVRRKYSVKGCVCVFYS